MIARASTRDRTATFLAWVSTALRFALAGVLLAAGGLKAIDPQSSVAAVRAYQVLTPGAELLVGWALPFVEIAVGLLLVAGIATRAVAVVTALIFTVFIVAVTSAWQRGLSIDCGCFGGGGTVAAGQTNYTGELIRDTLFLLMALWLVWHPVSKLALDRLALDRPVGGPRT